MKLSPLIPEPGDPRVDLVKTYQRYLVSRGATLKVDGKYGPYTDDVADRTKQPAEVAVPPLCAWVDRSWAADGFVAKLDEVKARHGFLPARVGLFQNSLDDGPSFRPFASAAKLEAVITELASRGVGVDLTAWIYPSKDYIDKLTGYVKPAMTKFPGVRLDLDCESAWSSGPNAEYAKHAAYLYSKVDPCRVSVNDYASLQSVTRHLIVPGVRVRPQAYSVGYVTHGGERKSTTTESIYYPGETQCWALDASRWGEYKSNVLDVGLGAYKPVPGMRIKAQVYAQVQAALWFNPAELWFWSFRTDEAYLDALGSLQA